MVVIEDKNFEKFKEEAWNTWLEAKRKGEVDAEIIPLIELINSHPDLYTTSSCYGRITLSYAPLYAKKYQHEFIAKWHRIVNWDEFYEKIVEWKEKIKKDILWLKVYPLIIHIGCRNLEIASKLLRIAIESGLKESGIFELENRIMLRVEGVDRLEVALGENGRIWVGEDFLRKELEVANSRFLRNVEKVERFFKNLKEKLF